MRTRILTAAVAFVIGTAAATLAQRQGDTRSQKVGVTPIALATSQEPSPAGPSSPPMPLPVAVAPPATEIPAPSELAVPTLPPDPPSPVQALPPPVAALPPPVASPTDPNSIASAFVTKAKAEIARLMGEKREAEKELARVKARIRAAEIGIAKWHSLAEAMTTAMTHNETSPDDPVGTVELVPDPGEPLPSAKTAEPTLAPDPMP